jgi:hypothetical protein
MSDKKISAFIIRDFKDAGTEQSYKQGGIQDIPEGQFINYEAAGLVRRPTADDKSAAAKSTKSDGNTAG